MGQTESIPQTTNNVRSLLSALDEEIAISHESHDKLTDGKLHIPSHLENDSSTISTDTSTTTSTSTSPKINISSSPIISRRASVSITPESEREQMLSLLSQDASLTSDIINIIDDYIRSRLLILTFDLPFRIHIYDAQTYALRATYQPQLMEQHTPTTTHTSMTYVSGVQHTAYDRMLQDNTCIVILDDDIIGVAIQQIIHVIEFKPPKIKKPLSFLETATEALSAALAHANDPPRSSTPVVTATCLRLMMGHSRPISCMRLLSDRQTLISATVDRLSPPRLWYWRDGTCIGMLDDVNMSPTLQMTELHRSSNDSNIHIITFHIDQFRIWDLSSRTCIATYTYPIITTPIPSFIHLHTFNHKNIILFSRSLSKIEMWQEDEVVKPQINHTTTQHDTTTHDHTDISHQDDTDTSHHDDTDTSHQHTDTSHHDEEYGNQHINDSKHNTPETRVRKLNSPVFRHKSSFHVVHSSLIDMGNGRVACSFENTVGIFDLTSHLCLFVIQEAFLPTSQYRSYIETHKQAMHTSMCRLGEHQIVTTCDTGRTNVYAITNSGCELIHSTNCFNVGVQYHNPQHRVGVMAVVPPYH